MNSESRNSDRCTVRPVIYQLFPRLLTNDCDTCKPGGSLSENGCGKFKRFTPKVLREIRKLGVNTLWFTGVIEMATKSAFPEEGIDADNPNVVKGEAGSPYAIRDYYDVAPSLACNVKRRIDEFKSLIDRVHGLGMKVMLDFVPNHTARKYHSDMAAEEKDFGHNDDNSLAFSPSNDYYYIPGQPFRSPVNEAGTEPYPENPARATGNDCFCPDPSVNDWYETAKLNYGHDYGNGSDHFDPVPGLWIKMRDILDYWASMGADGFRCDMVFMVPLAFWHWVIPQIKRRHEGTIFIGEIYNVDQYRSFIDYGCFDYLYDKVNLYDTLGSIIRGHARADALTGAWQRIDGIGHRMLNFMENHDELRLASEFFAGSPEKGFPATVVSACISSGPFMIYYGQELGEPGMDAEGYSGRDGRTTIFDYWSPASMRRWYASGRADGSRLLPEETEIRKKYQALLLSLNASEALRCGSFFDLTYANYDNPGFDPARHYAFLRHSPDETLLVAVNFSSEPSKLSIRIPEHAFSCLHLADGTVKGRELLTGAPAEFRLSLSEPTVVELPSYGAVLLSTSHSRITKSKHIYNL